MNITCPKCRDVFNVVAEAVVPPSQVMHMKLTSDHDMFSAEVIGHAILEMEKLQRSVAKGLGVKVSVFLKSIVLNAHEISLKIFLSSSANHPGVIEEIESEQRHGRQKYCGDPSNFSHDDSHTIDDWLCLILRKCDQADKSTPQDARQLLIQIAGLAKSAVESFDRKAKTNQQI